jgi:hypothetical protein
MKLTLREEAEVRTRIDRVFSLREAGQDGESGDEAMAYGRWLTCLIASRLTGMTGMDVEISNSLCERVLRQPKRHAHLEETIRLLQETRPPTGQEWRIRELKARLS